jgi:TctA family transporter
VITFFREHESLTTVLNYVAGGTVIGTLIGWLPSIAAVFSIAWIGMQIYDRLVHGPKR